jgi:cytidine deaminase
MISKAQQAKLVKTAIKVLKNSYSPHSGFKVGSALLGKNGKIYAGTNVEFDAFSLTVCAERAALFNGISGGEKNTAIAVATSSDKFIYPLRAMQAGAG